jgi:hypothetical protein
MKARRQKTRQAKKAQPLAKKRRVDNESSEIELEEGQELVGVVVKAPKTGIVPPGQISQNTFDFLGKLNDPDCNNRKW